MQPNIRVSNGLEDKQIMQANNRNMSHQRQLRGRKLNKTSNSSQSKNLSENDRFFAITRSQAFRMVVEAFDRAGTQRPRRDRDRVGAVHILRHSAAIERLSQTGNPQAVQGQLRHKSALMTMRYLKTLSADESLRIQQEVEFRWQETPKITKSVLTLYWYGDIIRV